MPSKGQTLKCLPDLRGLKDKDAQHCMNNPIYNTKKKKMQQPNLCNLATDNMTMTTKI